MKNLKTNKATGHDQIPAQAVKESAEILCPPLSCLVNFLFERGKSVSKLETRWNCCGPQERLYINKDKLSPYNNPASLIQAFEKLLLHTLKMFILIMSLHIEIIMGATQLSLV